VCNPKINNLIDLIVMKDFFNFLNSQEKGKIELSNREINIFWCVNIPQFNLSIELLYYIEGIIGELKVFCTKYRQKKLAIHLQFRQPSVKHGLTYEDIQVFLKMIKTSSIQCAPDVSFSILPKDIDDWLPAEWYIANNNFDLVIGSNTSTLFWNWKICSNTFFANLIDFDLRFYRDLNIVINEFEISRKKIEKDLQLFSPLL
jgi:hypothetical protein